MARPPAGASLTRSHATTPGAPGEPVVRAEGLVHRYRATAALDGVDLEVDAGCLLGVLGPDGVGKSTLLGLVAGARRLQGGTLRVLGGDLARRGHRRRVCDRIAYMPQGLGRNLYPDLSVRENVAFFAQLFGVSSERAGERIGRLLDATGLGEAAERPARNLSGGMKQKLGLCCALVHEPSLLVLDEPTTGVDPLSRRSFWELVAELRERHPALALLVATSYMDEAEAFDTLLLMHDGRALARGAPAALRERTGADRLEAAYARLLEPTAAARGPRAGRAHPSSPTSEGDVVIEARRLTRRFGSFTAVDAVSFEVHRGEIFGFVGPNGSGKTTTMKMVTGVLPASEGEARLLGEPVSGRSLAQRRHTGYMSQSFSLYEELTVRENLALFGRLFDLGGRALRERVTALLERFDLASRASARAGELPLGIRQRLALAAALLHRPEIVVLDEPTSGVDPVARASFWEAILDLARGDGVAVFVSTHYLAEAERCDRVALMNAGRILACAAPEELVRRQGAVDLEAAFVATVLADRASTGGAASR